LDRYEAKLNSPDNFYCGAHVPNPTI